MYVQGFPEYGPERMGAPIIINTSKSAEEIALFQEEVDKRWEDLLWKCSRA